MKIKLIIGSLFLFAFTLAQTNIKQKYDNLIKKADSLSEHKDFKSAGLAYSTAFRMKVTYSNKFEINGLY